MDIRPLSAEYIPRLVELVFRYKRGRDPGFPETAGDGIRRTFSKSLDERTTRTWVYLEDGLACGYIMCHVVNYPMLAGSEAYVSDLLIDENCRGTGAGGALLARVEEHAVANGCIRIMLNNPKESEGYRREFYKKHGFTERLAFANFVKEITEPGTGRADGTTP